ncbi:popeye domain-containing protein 1-like [Babylonia areolata]|uniref:popeye domain-containing protein 1-like n=1 Tax=Babylonia areolata TaxID=304850 RepID=UPI003FD0C5A4
MNNSSLAVSALTSSSAANVSGDGSLWGLLGGVPPPRFPLLPPHSLNHSSNNMGWANGTYNTVKEEEHGPGEGVGVGVGGRCGEWQDSQHTLFQLANLCAALAFLTPPTFRFHLLFLRAMLLLSFLLSLLWAGLFVCMADVLCWSLALLLLSGGHLAWVLYRHLASSLHHPQAGLYSKVFRPVKVTEAEFRDLCEQGALHHVSKGALYAIEGATPCAYLSILVKGRLKVTFKRLLLHHVETNQFVDATEYDFLSSHQDHSDTYQVSISAVEDSVLLRWDYPTLQGYLSTRPFISTVLHYLTGKDVCSQLYALQEQLMQTPEFMADLPSRHSSMVNVRSCLAARDSSVSLCRLSDVADSCAPHETVHTSATSRHPPSHTEAETRL